MTNGLEALTMSQENEIIPNLDQAGFEQFVSSSLVDFHHRIPRNPGARPVGWRGILLIVAVLAASAGMAIGAGVFSP